MSSGPIEELAVPYDPTELEALVLRRRAQVRSRIISLGFTVVILTVIYFWQAEQLRGVAAIAVAYSFAIALSLGWLAVVVIRYRLARADLTEMGEGTALRIERSGVQVADLYAGWSEVASLAMAKGGLGRGMRLQLSLADGRQASVRLNQISVFPATLDSTTRAYSGGRHGVDLTALEL